MEPARFFRNEILEVSELYLTQIPKEIVDFFDLVHWMWYFTNNEKW